MLGSSARSPHEHFCGGDTEAGLRNTGPLRWWGAERCAPRRRVSFQTWLSRVLQSEAEGVLVVCVTDLFVEGPPETWATFSLHPSGNCSRGDNDLLELES